MNRIERGIIAKEWLRKLVEDSGVSRPELAERVGVDQQTIKNMAGPKPALAGLTMLLLLQELDALVENPIPRSSLEQRLREVEGAVDEMGRQIEIGAGAVAERLGTIEGQLRQLLERGALQDPAADSR